MFSAASLTRTPPASIFPSRPGLLTRLLRARRIRHELAAMCALDDHLLDDIGVSRAEAETLAYETSGLPKWDVPAHWRA